MTKELTQTQEAFVDDLKHYGTMTISMVQLQKNYSHIDSKASIKRNIESLIADGIVERFHFTKNNNGRVSSTTIYQLK